MVVKPNASPNELFIEALKQKQGKQKEQILQFAGIAENISAEQIDGYDGAKIQSAKEKGLTTINITVDSAVIAGKTEKLLELIKSAHANGLKVVFNYKVDFRKTGLDAFIKNYSGYDENFQTICDRRN
jgi:sugar/nucleoside kinase (ribokinase family)